MSAYRVETLPHRDLGILRRRARILQLLDAAERASVTPINTYKFHAFAYLADVLSPVWELPTFTGAVLKMIGGPFYPDLQREVDRLVGMGLVEITNLSYEIRPRKGARMLGNYALRFGSPYLGPLLAALGGGDELGLIDARDQTLHRFLVELASALARLPDDEIDKAASLDVTYSDRRIATNNLLEFDLVRENGERNLSVVTARRFNAFVPPEVSLSAGEQIFLYATYLGRRINASR